MPEYDEKTARNWGLFCHLSAFLLWIGIPFGNIIGPLVIWLMKKDEIPLVDQEGKESLNFQISITMYLIVAGILTIVLIGLPLLFVILIAQIVLVIVASVKVSNGEHYQYPFTIRLIN